MKSLYLLLLWAPMMLGQATDAPYPVGKCVVLRSTDTQSACIRATSCPDTGVIELDDGCSYPDKVHFYLDPEVMWAAKAKTAPPKINLDLNCNAALCVGSDGKSRNGLPTPTIDERGCKHYDFSVNGVSIEGIDCPKPKPVLACGPVLIWPMDDLGGAGEGVWMCQEGK